MLDEAKLKRFRQRLNAWANKHLRDFPWRRTNDPYAIFIAESLLQKTDVAKVAAIYETFLAKYPNFNALAAAPAEAVAKLLQPLGLFFRAERLCQAAQIVVDLEETPRSESEWLKLPGVGKYTARSICANVFNQPLAILDTNVARILERYFGLQGDRVKSRCPLLWSAAEQVAPETEVSRWNLTLLDFGATVCTAQNPRCTDCPLYSQCHYAQTLTPRVTTDSEESSTKRTAHVPAPLQSPQFWGDIDRALPRIGEGLGGAGGHDRSPPG